MINTDLQDILSEDNVSEALENLGRKNNSCGNDGIMLSEMPDHWRINGDHIRKEIFANEYTPGIVKNVEIVNYQGKRRTITLFNSTDRLIIRAMIQKIQPECEKLMPSCCYAFRQGTGVQDAIAKACEYMSEGHIYMVKTDIKGFFDNIHLGKMCSMINRLFLDAGLKTLLKRFLFLKVDEGGKIAEKKKGIIQGSAISPLLSNLYLLAFDEYMTEKAYRYIRYSDDIAVFTEDISAAEGIYSDIYIKLKQDFSLDVNEKKSGVFEGLKQIYLGYRFEENKKTKTVTAVKNRRGAEVAYRYWHCDCIKKTDRNYHIVNDGVLTKRDYTVLFENETGKYYIPVETTKAINIYSDITFSSNFFKFMSGKNLCVNMFDKFGNYEGSFHGSRSSYNAKAMLGQAGSLFR